MSMPTVSSSMKKRMITNILSTLVLLFACFVTKSQTSIDLSKPVGMTPGEVGSNGAGGALYTVPIQIPGGIKELNPNINLSYSSQGVGNGYSGHGWSLTGMSMISRAGKDFFHNGIATPIDHTGSNDAFVLDGQRLILISGSNGADGSVYGTEQEGFSKIEAKGGNGNSPTWFKVTTKNGTILEYGTDNSVFKTNDGTNIIFWLLRRVIDANGNYMIYNYNIDNANRYYSLASIQYTGNTNGGIAPNYQIVFTYNTKTDYQSLHIYISGHSNIIYYAKILERIDVKKMDNTQIRSYTFSYEYRHKKYFLTSVVEKGADDTALNPIAFTYGNNPNAPEVLLSVYFN